MARRTLFKWVVLVVFAASVSFGSRKKEAVLVLIPHTESMVKVGMDMARRQPVLLLSYKADATGVVSLHGWTGSRWGIVKLEDFRAGRFLRTELKAAIMIAPKGRAFPASIIPAGEWAPSLYRITTTQVRPVVHLLGRHFDFRYKDWQWFANRYGFEMNAINPEGLNLFWYHKRPGEHFEDAGGIAAADLSSWVVVREPEPAVELPKEADANPLTGEMPAAVVLGAADAVETNITVDVSAE